MSNYLTPEKLVSIVRDIVSGYSRKGIWWAERIPNRKDVEVIADALKYDPYFIPVATINKAVEIFDEERKRESSDNS